MDTPYFRGRELCDLLPFLELEWFREAAKRARARWVLHAAALAVGGRGIVLSGRSGAGKTTLTFALLHTGARYVTDEIAALTPTEVSGVPRLLYPTSATEPLPSTYRLASSSFTNRENQQIETNCFVPPPEVVVQEGIPLDLLVHLDYRGPGPTRVRSLTSADAIERFFRQTLTPSPEALKIALDALKKVSAVELIAGSVEGALGALGKL